MDRAASPLRRRPRRSSLCPHPYPSPSPPTLPPGYGFILTYLFWERRGRGQGSSTSFSKGKETNDHATRLSSVPSSPSFLSSSPFSSFLSYPPCYTSTPPPRCVYCCVPDGLVVVFILILPCPRAPSALGSVLRCAARRTAGSPASSSKSLVVMSFVILV